MMRRGCPVKHAPHLGDAHLSLHAWCWTSKVNSAAPCLHQVSQSGWQCSMVSQLVKHQPQPETSGWWTASWTDKWTSVRSPWHGIVIWSSAQELGVHRSLGFYMRADHKILTKLTRLLLARCGRCNAPLSLYAWWRWNRIWHYFHIQIIISM